MKELSCSWDLRSKLHFLGFEIIFLQLREGWRQHDCIQLCAVPTLPRVTRRKILKERKRDMRLHSQTLIYTRLSPDLFTPHDQNFPDFLCNNEDIVVLVPPPPPPLLTRDSSLSWIFFDLFLNIFRCSQASCQQQKIVLSKYFSLRCLTVSQRAPVSDHDRASLKRDVSKGRPLFLRPLKFC